MKLLVIQEQHFVKMPNGEVWVDGQSDKKFWQRYLNVFDQIVVCARFKHASEYNVKGLIQSDCENVTFLELPDSRGVASLIKNMPTIIKIMKKGMEICDRIIFRAPSPISMIAYPVAKKSGKPFAAELMNNPYTHFSPEAMHHFYQPLLRKFIVNQTKSLCMDANGISYVTEHVLQDLYPSRASIYGESNKFFEGSYSTIRMEKEQYSFDEWPIEKPKVITLIHTGKMEDNRKGQDVFIKTINILVKKGYNIQGILVGDGEKRKDFEELSYNLGIKNRLNFVGWKAGFENVCTELKKAQFAVFPSMGEGLPRSVIEAMSQGLLCFGSNVDGIIELLDDDCLILDYTAESFAKNIEFYLNHWDKVLIDRKKQFQKSLKYEYSKLQFKRNEFYIKLRDCY